MVMGTGKHAEACQVALALLAHHQTGEHVCAGLHAEMALDSVSPGPGRYNAHAVDLRSAFKPTTLPSDGSGFGVASQRFKGGGAYTPGPVSGQSRAGAVHPNARMHDAWPASAHTGLRQAAAMCALAIRSCCVCLHHLSLKRAALLGGLAAVRGRGCATGLGLNVRPSVLPCLCLQGTYAAHGDLVRKSFNITYHGVEVA